MKIDNDDDDDDDDVDDDVDVDEEEMFNAAPIAEPAEEVSPLPS